VFGRGPRRFGELGDDEAVAGVAEEDGASMELVGVPI
jgi:hypothetical protein